MSELKLCKDCRWLGRSSRCMRPEALYDTGDVVHGGKVRLLAFHMRIDAHLIPCGLEAKLWERRSRWWQRFWRRK